MKPLISTEGMSGGHLVRFPQQKKPVLVGLARSRVELDHHDGSYTEWCEPAIEAVRLLLKHPNPDVAAAATRIVAKAAVASVS